MSKIKLFDNIKGILLHGTQDVTAQGGIKNPKYSLVNTNKRLEDVEDMTTYFDKYRHIDKFKATIKVYHIDELVDDESEDFMVKKTAENATVYLDCYTIEGKFGVALEDTEATTYHREYTVNQFGEVTITVPRCDIFQVYAKKPGYGAAPRQVYRQVTQDIDLCLLPLTNNWQSDRGIYFPDWKYHNTSYYFVNDPNTTGGHYSLNTLKSMTCYYIKDNEFIDPSTDDWFGPRSWAIENDNVEDIDGLLIIDEDASFVVLPNNTVNLEWSKPIKEVKNNPSYFPYDEIYGDNQNEETRQKFFNDYNGNFSTQAVVLNWGKFQAAQRCDAIKFDSDSIIQQPYLPTLPELVLASMAHQLVLRKLFKVPNDVDFLWRSYDPENPDGAFNRWYWSIGQYSSQYAWSLYQSSSSNAHWYYYWKGSQNDVLACASLIL